MIDLALVGGIVVTPTGMRQMGVYVQNGVIVAIGREAGMPQARETLDCTGLHVLPGAVDVHVHFRDPGSTYKETWKTGSAAAAVGGVTTVLDMPNTDPATHDVRTLDIKRARAAELSYVDYGLYAVLDESSMPHLEALVAAGVVGFKCFMTETTGDLASPDDGCIFEGFQRLAQLGVRCSVHAENAPIMQRRRQQLMDAGRSDPQAHEESRPEVCEIEAVQRAGSFALAAGARLHIAHVSSGGGADVIRQLRAAGQDVTAETCPQYLLFGEKEIQEKGGMVRVNPPIRGNRHSEALWAALHDGTIGMIATDHAPHTEEEKTDLDIWKCCRGMIGLETQMSVMLTEAQRGRMSILQYALWSATQPAQAWGVYPRKGVIAIGSDADFAVVDTGVSSRINQSELQSLNRISPWNGRLVTARPIHTVVRGQIVVRARRLSQPHGCGQEVLAQR